MTFRTLLIIKAVVCLAFGVYLLVAPASLFGLMGASLSGGWPRSSGGLDADAAG